MDIILNGDLYVKLTNEVVYVLEENDKTKAIIKDIMGDVKDNEEELLALASFKFAQIMDKLIEEQLLYKEEESLDKNGFYKIFYTGNEVIMMSDEENIKYNSLEEVNKKYINLRDFLIRATLVGRYLEPIKDNLPRYAVIYEYEDCLLLHNLNNGMFTTVNAKSSILNNYFLGDNLIEEYKKEDVYQTIVNQELKKGKSRN